MCTLYSRGTRAMNDLVVAHLVENLPEEERPPLLLADAASLRPSGESRRLPHLPFPRASVSRFDSVIREEDESFSKLLYHCTQRINATAATSRSPASFGATHFAKSSKEAIEPLWGKGARIGNSSSPAAGLDESTRPSCGSVMGFEAGELDPVNSLSGFLDHVPMRLRRKGKTILPKAASEVKLMSAGKVLENTETVGQCKMPSGDVGGGGILMHVVVQSSLARKRSR